MALDLTCCDALYIIHPNEIPCQVFAFLYSRCHRLCNNQYVISHVCRRHTHQHANSHTHTHADSLSPTRPRTHSLTPTHAGTHSPTHRTPSPSPSPSPSLSLSLSLFSQTATGHYLLVVSLTKKGVREFTLLRSSRNLTFSRRTPSALPFARSLLCLRTSFLLRSFG